MPLDHGRELERLVSLGPRFPGTAGIDAAADLIIARLRSFGLEPETSPVRMRGWQPGSRAALATTAPERRPIPCWPMLWSPGSGGQVSGSLTFAGRQGLWRDSMVWTKLALRSADEIVAYVHIRDSGPAAPQPLPAGSDETVPHVVIGRLDGEQILEWLEDGRVVSADLRTDCSYQPELTSETLSVTLPGQSDRGTALVCGHYDTFWNTPGAYDNGSGTVALLSLAERWAARPPGRPVKIVFFTGEEWHLAGSRAYVANATSGELDELAFVLNVDGLGRGDRLEVPLGPESLEPPLLEIVGAHARESGRSGLHVASRFPPVVGSDHAPFYAAGVPAAQITFNDPNRLHQPDDLPNPGIVRNIDWAVPLVEKLVAGIGDPIRAARGDLP